MDHRGKALVGLVVARSNPPKRFELTKEVFNQMAPAIDMKVAGDRVLAVGFGGNDRNSATLIQFDPQPIDIKGFVGEQSGEIKSADQRHHPDAVMALPGQQNKAHQIAQGIDQGHDLGGRAAARAADGLSLSSPFAPVPCWWTRTMVPSMIAYSKSGSPDKAAKILSKTPAKAQRRKRTNVEFHFPNAAGRSRQGDPVRAIHSTASRKRRLSSPERPGSPTFPGSSGATRCHCSSLKTLRSKANLCFRVVRSRSHTREIPLGPLNVNRP